MEKDRIADATIVAVYESLSYAEAAVADLKRAGVPAIGISVYAGTARPSGLTTTVSGREQGFWSNLFGGEPDHAAGFDDAGAAGGSTVVTVRTPDTLAAQVVEILESHEPIDVDEGAGGERLKETTPTLSRPPVATMPVPATTSDPGRSRGDESGETGASKT